MSQFTESDITLMLLSSKDQQSAQLARDTALVKSLVKVLNVSLEMAKSPPKSAGSLAMSLAKKSAAISGVAEKATNSQGLRTANFVASQALQSMGLTKIVGMSPAKASAHLTIAMANKIVSAAGLGGISKCKMAIASLATSTGAGALTCFATGALTLGVGCVAGAIAVAADAFDMYGQCYRSN